MPRQSEPKSIADFLKAGHPWMALAIALSWLWRPAMIVFTLLALRVFLPPDHEQTLPVSKRIAAHANAQNDPDRIK
jgi:hypothetical protein